MVVPDAHAQSPAGGERRGGEVWRRGPADEGVLYGCLKAARDPVANVFEITTYHPGVKVYQSGVNTRPLPGTLARSRQWGWDGGGDGDL